MNLNINDYTQNELLELVGVSKQDINVLSVKNNVVTLIKKLGNDNKESKNNKDKITMFLLEAFQKICSHNKLSYTKQDIDEIQNIFTKKDVTDIHNYVVQNRDLILREPREENESVFSKKYKFGTLNQLNRQSRKMILNINTRFRKDYHKTDSTDYIMTLPNPIRNVLSLKLISSEIPSVLYTFSSKLRTNEFTIITYDTTDPENTREEHVIKILNGYYSSSQLVEYLNDNIFDISSTYGNQLENIECYIDEYTGKFIFKKKYTASTNFGFDLDFRLQDNKKRSVQLNMGWIFGYRKECYVYDEDYHMNGLSPENPKSLEGFIPESTYDLGFTKYFLLHINDFNNNHSVLFDSPFQQGMLKSSDIIAKIPNTASSNQEVYEYAYMFNDNSDRIYKTREYFGPVNIEKIEIKLLDEFGRAVDLNHNDYSFSLELDIVYDL